MTAEVSTALTPQLDAVEREVTPSEVERKQRRGIVNHLTRTLERQIRGSKLHPFGSAETGLVLRRGDVDLCLVVKDIRKPKGVLRHLANVLESEDYRDIQTIGRAKVPIVKFTDAATGIPVDLSLNNALALRNTELIAAYVDLDPRVKSVALAVKHWALQRGLANAFNGTLSSYAWTVLVLRHLQSVDAPIVPNLQA
ncbi:MAG: nucleotidyltransferase domain-containing protein, partial [Candidatus Thermoplasmatota archaeon]|nr:nucleotidyltransferase domain-containing protein [Candidatus Thermoplasmatota archaeon]